MGYFTRAHYRTYRNGPVARAGRFLFTRVEGPMHYSTIVSKTRFITGQGRSG